MEKKHPYRLSGLPELCIIAYSFMDGLAPRGVVLWQLSFAVIFAATALFIFANPVILKRSLSEPRMPDWLFLTIILTGAFYGMLQQPFFPNYYAGDFGLLVLAYFYYAYLRQAPERFNDETIKRLSVWVGVTCFVSFLSSQLSLFPQFMHGSRFDYPRVLAVIGLAYAVVVSRGWGRMLYFAMFVGLAALSFMSGWRASLAFVALGAGYMVIGTFSRTGRIWLVAIVAYLSIFPFVFLADILAWLESIAQGTRFALLFRETGDDSFLGRVTEAQDVIYYYTHTFSVYEQFFGKGHGATFTPILSFPEDNIAAGWVVHNIHFNFFLMLYRYGALGAVAYVTFAGLVVRELFVVTFGKQNLFPSPRGAAAFLGLGILVLSANYTPLNEPSNLYCIAAIAALYAARKSKISATAAIPRKNERALTA